MNSNIQVDIFLLENSDIPLNEVNFDSISKSFKKFTKADQKKIHNAALKKIGDIFEEDFARFLIKKNKLRTFGKAIDIASLISRAKQGDDKALQNIENFIVLNLIDYYRSKLNKFFFQRSFTGSRLLDDSYKAAFESFFYREDVVKLLKQQADEILRGKTDDILDIVIEEKKSFKQRKRDIRDFFSSKIKKIRYRVIDDVFDNVKGIKKELKIQIKRGLDGKPDREIISIYDDLQKARNKMVIISDIVAEPSIDYIRNIIFNKYFKDNDYMDFKKILTIMMRDKSFEKTFRKEMIARDKLSRL